LPFTSLLRSSSSSFQHGKRKTFGLYAITLFTRLNVPND
jgi:hypothetical protein